MKNPLEPWNGWKLFNVPHLLAELKDASRLHDLFALTTNTQQNAFFEATEQFPGETNFLNSIHEAWRLAEIDYVPAAEDQSSRNIGYQARYALIASSLNSYVRKISPSMLIALVEKQVWSVQRAFLYAKSRFQDGQRKQALCQLGPHLDGNPLMEAVKICWDEETADWAARELALAPELCLPVFQRAFALAWQRLARHGEQYWPELHWVAVQALEEKQSLIPDAQVEASIRLLSSRPCYNEKVAAGLLARLASVGQVSKALEYARRFRYLPMRIHATVSLLPFVSDVEKKSLLEELIRCVDGYYSLSGQVELWALLVPHLSDEPGGVANNWLQAPMPPRRFAVEQTLARARAITEPSERANAIAHLLGYVSPTEQPELVREIFGLLQQAQDKTISPLIQRIAPLLDDSWWDEIFQLLNLLKNNRRRYELIAELAQRLPEERLAAVLELFPTFEDKWQRGYLFVDLLPRLMATHLFNTEDTDVIAFLNEHDIEKHVAFPALVPFLSEQSQAQVLQHLYADYARAVEEDNSHLKFETEKALEVLAPRLPESLVRQAVEALTPPFDPLNFRRFEFYRIRDVVIPELARFGAHSEVFAAMRANEAAKEKVIPKLAHYIPREAFGELWSFAKEQDSSRRESVVDRMIDAMPAEFLGEALGVDASINDEAARVDLLLELARVLFLTQCMDAAARIMQQIPKSQDLAEFWEELIQRAPEANKQNMVELAVRSIAEIESASSRCDALIRLAPHLTEEQRVRFLPDIISYASTHSEFDIIEHKVKRLVDLAQFMPAEHKETLLDLALRTARKGDRSSSLEEPGEKLARLPKEQIQIINSALSAWSGNLTGDLFQSWFIAWASVEGERGLNGIFGLLSWVPEEPRLVILWKCYDAGWEIRDAATRAEWFVRLFRLFPTAYSDEALVEALVAVRLVSDVGTQSKYLGQLMRCFAWGDSEHSKVHAELARLSKVKSDFARRHPNVDVDQRIQRVQASGTLGVSRSRFRRMVRSWVKFRQIPFPDIEPAPLPELKSHSFPASIMVDDPFTPIQAMLHIAAALAPEQRQPLLDDILVRNRGWPDYDKQGKTLLEVALLTPAGERMPLVQEALSKLHQDTEVTHAEPSLYKVMEHLSPEERVVVLPELMQFAISSDWAPYLDEANTRECLRQCTSSTSSHLANSGTGIFAVRLAELGHLDEALEYFAQYPLQDDVKSWGLKRLTDSADLRQLDQLMSLAQTLGNEYYERDQTMATLADRLGELGEFSKALNLVLEEIPPESNERPDSLIGIAARMAESGEPENALNVIRETIPKDSSAYARGLCRLLEYFPDHAQMTLEAFYVACSLADSVVLDELAWHLFQLAPGRLYVVWQDFLHSMESRTRTELISSLKSLSLLVAHLGWEEAICEIATSIQDVGRWWP